MQLRKLVDEKSKLENLNKSALREPSVTAEALNKRVEPDVELKELPIHPAATLSSSQPTPASAAPATAAPSSELKREPSTTPAKLRYLDSITREKLSELEKKYGRSAQELEAIIDDYWKSYWFELTANYVGISTNLLYIVFQATANKAGIDGTVALFNPDAVVPDAVSTGLGGFLAAGGLTFVFAISAKNEAAEAILAYALRDPIKERVSDALKFAANNKARAFIDSFKAVAHQSVLLGTYMTGALSEIIPIIDYLNNRTSFEKWLAIASIQYFCCRFSSAYATPSYYEGVKFWENEKGQPYLISELMKGNIATPLQVFFQGIISSSLIRAYPNYNWIAAAGAKAIGAWPHPAFISFLVFANSLCTLYPATYNHYMSDGQKIDELLRRNIDWNAVKQLAQQQFSQLNITELSADDLRTHLDRIANDLIQSEKQTLRTHIENKKGTGYVFKEEPSTAVTTTWQSLIGAYFGSQVLAPALAPLSAAPPALVAVSCGLFAAVVLGGLFYRAESNRVSDKMVLELLQAKEKEKAEKSEGKEKTDKPLEDMKQPTNSRFIKAASMAIPGINILASITGTIAASTKIQSTPSETTFFATTATQAGLNALAYNQPKVENILTSLFATKPKYEFADEDIDEWHAATVSKENEVEIKPIERSVSPATHPSALFSNPADEWVDVEPQRGYIEMASFKPL